MNKGDDQLLVILECPKSVVVRGERGLLFEWEDFTALLAQGKKVSLDYYLNRLDVRILLFALGMENEQAAELESMSEQLSSADQLFSDAMRSAKNGLNSQLPVGIRWLCTHIPCLVHADKSSTWRNALESVRLPDAVNERYETLRTEE